MKYIPQHLPTYRSVLIKLSAHADNSPMLTLLLNFCPLRSVAPLQLGNSFSFVLPISLPPEVAKGMMVLPDKS